VVSDSLEADVDRLLAEHPSIEGTGKRIRHVKIRSVEAARSDPVVALIRAEIAMHSGTAIIGVRRLD
jgi:hypothetical protein